MTIKKWSDNPDSQFFETKEIQTEAIKNCILKNGGHYFKNLNDENRNNPEIALYAIQHNPNLYVMERANDVIRDNKEIALLEIKNNGRAIGFLSSRLKADKEVAMMACSNFGEGLKYLSDELKQDEDVVCAAVTNDPFSIFKADSMMLSNKVVLDTAFKTYESNQKFYNDMNSDMQVKFFTNFKENYELSIKLENELPKQDDFRASLDKIDLTSLHAEVQERNKSVIIPENDFRDAIVKMDPSQIHKIIAEAKNSVVAKPDTNISEPYKPKEEVISQSHAEENNQPVIAQQPIKQRRLKL